MTIYSTLSKKTQFNIGHYVIHKFNFYLHSQIQQDGKSPTTLYLTMNPNQYLRKFRIHTPHQKLSFNKLLTIEINYHMLYFLYISDYLIRHFGLTKIEKDQNKFVIKIVCDPNIS